MLHTILEGEGVAAACVYGAMDQVGLGVLDVIFATCQPNRTYFVLAACVYSSDGPDEVCCLVSFWRLAAIPGAWAAAFVHGAVDQVHCLPDISVR